MSSYHEIEEIAQRFGSPFYLFDPTAFTRNFEDFRSGFRRRYPRTVIAYSYKTNYLPYLCRMVRELGGCAEVVSRLELDLALEIGCSPARIIFNGPLKKADDIALALSRGILVNLDTFRELDFVGALAAAKPAAAFRIGLRINIPLIDEAGNSHLQDAVPVGRFGFAAEALPEVVKRLSAMPNVTVCSLHGHTSTTSRSLWGYRTIAATLVELGERWFPNSVEFINVGGGFFGRRAPAMGLTDTPTYDDYAEAICGILHQNPWVQERRPRLVIEPGLAVVADTLSFFTRVFEIKNFGGRRLAVVDGSIFNVKPTQHRRNHPFSIIKKNGGSGLKGRYSIVGATCMDKDCLLKEVESVAIERDDFIRIENVGAYTVVLTPPFIHPAPPILVRGPQG
ncbi:MAG: diaminopimelate decarboxylase, partial [Deltaproteobacteria bacterium]|nr:diaminopimelate decarboxylase [Deltaproteobacteria bacterium]